MFKKAPKQQQSNVTLDSQMDTDSQIMNVEKSTPEPPVKRTRDEDDDYDF